jgi:hypothetical protein
MKLSLITNPPRKRFVSLVALWHHAMAILSFKFEQLFMLLVPEFVVVGAVIFPSEANFVKKSLSIRLKFVLLMIDPLRIDPQPKSFVLLVASWHHAMAILQFKLAQLFMIHVPLLVMFRHGSQMALSSKATKVGGCRIAKRQSVLLTT